MIQKVAFTPQVTPAAEINFAGTQQGAEEIQQAENKDNSGLLLGSLAALGGLGVGLLARNPKVVEKGVVKVVEKTAKEAEKAAEPALKKLTAEEQEAIWKQAAKQHKNMYIAEKASQGTTKVSQDLIKTSNPQMRPAQPSAELQALKNDMIARAALEDVKKVEQAAKKTVTNAQTIARNNPHMRPAALEGQAYTDKELELLEALNPTAYKHRMINTINHNNAVERAQKNTVGNLASPTEKGGLVRARYKNVRDEEYAKFLTNGGHVNKKNGNIYFTKDGKVTQIIEKDGGRVITDEKKIAKHMAKHNVRMRQLLNEKELDAFLAA